MAEWRRFACFFLGRRLALSACRDIDSSAGMTEETVIYSASLAYRLGEAPSLTDVEVVPDRADLAVDMYNKSGGLYREHPNLHSINAALLAILKP